MSLKVDYFKSLYPNVIAGYESATPLSDIPEIFLIKEGLREVASICSKAVASEPLDQDQWGFGWFWNEVKSQYHTVENLYFALKERLSEILGLAEAYRPLDTERNPFSEEIFRLSQGMNTMGACRIDPGRLQPIEDGISGSYFFLDEIGAPRFVVKPLDEDIGCLNNGKGFATPFIMSPIRNAMPLYRSSLREVLCFRIACSIDVASIAPKTELAFLESSRFYDFSNTVKPEERRRYFEELGLAEKEKLCSVQEYVGGSKTLFEALHDFQASGLSDKEIENRFDQRDYEDVNLLLWTSYDLDAHGGNILVYSKGTDDLGNERLGLKKIDNGLTFPDENHHLVNALIYLPNAEIPLSEVGRAKIAAIDIETLSSLAGQYSLESAIPSLRQRIAVLKELAKEPGITLKTINQKMSRIGSKI